MKTNIFYLSALLISFSSCSNNYYSYNYSDPNYLNSDEFTAEPIIEEEKIIIEENDYVEIEIVEKDTFVYDEGSTIINNYYEEDDDYNFYYSSRIRRFHRPSNSYGYYGNYYTNSYWYTGNPYHCGSSIYYSNGWNSPYNYGNYGYYDPYNSYYSYNYSPYYYGGHYNNNHHGNYYSWGNNNNISTNSEFGHRGSLNGGNRHQTEENII